MIKTKEALKAEIYQLKLENEMEKVKAGFLDDVNWNIISKNPNMTSEFAIKYEDEIDWEKVANKHILDIDFFSKTQEMYQFDWIDISSRDDLTDEFIDTFKERLIWWMISKNRANDDVFIEKYKDFLDWEEVSRYRAIITEEFIDKYIDYVWFSEFAGRLKSEELIRKYFDRIGGGWAQIDISRLSEEFITEIIERVPIKEIANIGEFIGSFSDEFIEKHADKIDWNVVSQHVSDKGFIRKYKDRLDLPTIYKNSVFDQSFFDEMSYKPKPSIIDELK